MTRPVESNVVRRLADCIELLPKYVNSPAKMPFVQEVVQKALERINADREALARGFESLAQGGDRDRQLNRGKKYRLDLRDAEDYRKKAEDYSKPANSVWLSDTDQEALKAALVDTGILERYERQAADIAEWLREYRHPRDAEHFRSRLSFVCGEALFDTLKGVEVSPGVFGLDLSNWETEAAKPLCDYLRQLAREMELRSSPSLLDRIEVDVSKSRVLLDNTWYEVTPDAAVLFDACVKSYPKPVLANHLDGDIRPKRIKKSLPSELQAIFHSVRGRGCWLECNG